MVARLKGSSAARTSSAIDQTCSVTPSAIAGVQRNVSCTRAEVIEGDPKSHGGAMVLKFFAVGVREPREPAHLHPR